MTNRVTSIDYVRLQWRLALPMVLGGLVAPSRRHWPYLVRRQSTAATYRILRSIRKKYGPRTWSRFPFKSTLLVLDRDGIKEVLDSKDNFADPFLKKFPLSCFTPSGVIVSRNQPLPTPEELWSTRRPVNDHALDFGTSQHSDADVFASIVHDEVTKLLDARPDVLVWEDFSTLAAKISQRVIFGEYCPDFEQRVSRIVSASNWGIARHCDLRPFFKRLRTQLDAPRAGHLVCRAAQWLTKNGNRDHQVRPSSQVAFWAFVMKDMIELHTVRTLALIVQAPPDVQRRLRKEVLAAGPPIAAAVDGMHFLEACVKEQLRLWTPVPILLRKAVKHFELCADAAGTAPKIAIRKGNWILLHTGFYHRDAEVFGAAAQGFRPEDRVVQDHHDPTSVTNSDPPLYVFSRHQQACAGQFLAIFLLKAVLAALLRRGPYVLLDGKTDPDAVPAAIDQFGLRFWRRRREPSANPRARMP